MRTKSEQNTNTFLLKGTCAPYFIKCKHLKNKVKAKYFSGLFIYNRQVNSTIRYTVNLYKVKYICKIPDFYKCNIQFFLSVRFLSFEVTNFRFLF